MPSNKKNKKKDKGTSGNDAGGLVKYCPEGQALWLANMAITSRYVAPVVWQNFVQ